MQHGIYHWQSQNIDKCHIVSLKMLSLESALTYFIPAQALIFPFTLGLAFHELKSWSCFNTTHRSLHWSLSGLKPYTESFSGLQPSIKLVSTSKPVVGYNCCSFSNLRERETCFRYHAYSSFVLFLIITHWTGMTYWQPIQE